MKRLMLVGLALLMAFTLAYADQIQVPAPFERAKEIAMGAGLDDQGRYLALFEWNENGTDCAYVLGYLPNCNLIGIGDLAQGWVLEFNTETGEMMIWTYQGRFQITVQEEMSAVLDKAFEIFRILVARGLI